MIGSSVAERFAVTGVLREISDDVTVYTGHDTRLDKAVSIVHAAGTAAVRVEESAQKARVVRDRRLARILDVVATDEETWVVWEQPAGVRVSDIAQEKVLPVAVATEIARSANPAIEIATAHDLTFAPGLIDITVTRTGRVMLGGAGLDLGSRERDTPEEALARCWKEATDTSLPPLTGPAKSDQKDPDPSEDNDTEPSLTLTEALASEEKVSLDSLELDAYEFARRSEAGAIAPPPLPDVEMPSAAAPVSETDVEQEASDDTFVDTALLEPDPDAWEFDDLVAARTSQEDTDEPWSDLAQDWVYDRYPRLQKFDRRVRTSVDTVSGRMAQGEAFDPTKWIFLAIALVLVGGLVFGLVGLLSPYTPDIDLRNNPPANFPEFTRGPEPSPSE